MTATLMGDNYSLLTAQAKVYTIHSAVDCGYNYAVLNLLHIMHYTNARTLHPINRHMQTVHTDMLTLSIDTV